MALCIPAKHVCEVEWYLEEQDLPCIEKTPMQNHWQQFEKVTVANCHLSGFVQLMDD